MYMERYGWYRIMQIFLIVVTHRCEIIVFCCQQQINRIMATPSFTTRGLDHFILRYLLKHNFKIYGFQQNHIDYSLQPCAVAILILYSLLTRIVSQCILQHVNLRPFVFITVFKDMLNQAKNSIKQVFVNGAAGDEMYV